MAVAVKTNAHEDALLKALFQGEYPTAIFGGSYTGGTAVTLRLGLHSGDPGKNGTQRTNEVYDPASNSVSYARCPLLQQVAGLPVSGGQMTNNGQVIWPAALTGSPSGIVTHLSVGSDATGDGNLWYRTELQASLTLVSGMRPTLAASGGLQVSEE